MRATQEASHNSLEVVLEQNLDKKRSAELLLLVAAGLSCFFQMIWFWRLTHNNINFDAICYIGIARHLVDGDFHASLNGYWSPLFSWLMAVFSIFSGDLTWVGRAFSIVSFLVCLPLLYLFTLRLWHSRLLAAVAVLWFTLARGVVPISIYFIGADFLFTAFVLCYFLLLLRCLRANSARNWLLLGVAHGLAFLAKAFAMPWLALSTVMASFLSGPRSLKRTFLHAAAGLLVPIAIWSGWGIALRAKYGVFTPGYQSKWNLLDLDTRKRATQVNTQLSFLRDFSRSYDAYGLVDGMFPGSEAWHARLHISKVLPQILQNERHNLPEAIKQVVVLMTPGGVLAFTLAMIVLGKRKRPENLLAWIVLLDSIALVFGYCMLVFDSRYLLPLLPLLIALAVPFVLPQRYIATGNRMARSVAGGLLVLSTLFLLVYPGSLFRTWKRDYEMSVYDAARKLRDIPSCQKLVIIGSGPFLEHGVGWEAGIYSSYFAGCRIVAFTDKLPLNSDEIKRAQADLLNLKPDAILLLGTKGSAAYETTLGTIRSSQLTLSSKAILDDELGEVGSLVWSTDRIRE
jgi:4-amino-4-deoxy-L-arabinose transferase-like glycosyltransferase